MVSALRTLQRTGKNPNCFGVLIFTIANKKTTWTGTTSIRCPRCTDANEEPPARYPSHGIRRILERNATLRTTLRHASAKLTMTFPPNVWEGLIEIRVIKWWAWEVQAFPNETFPSLWFQQCAAVLTVMTSRSAHVNHIQESTHILSGSQAGPLIQKFYLIGIKDKNIMNWFHVFISKA